MTSRTALGPASGSISGGGAAGVASGWAAGGGALNSWTSAAMRRCQLSISPGPGAAPARFRAMHSSSPSFASAVTWTNPWLAPIPAREWKKRISSSRAASSFGWASSRATSSVARSAFSSDVFTNALRRSSRVLGSAAAAGTDGARREATLFSSAVRTLPPSVAGSNGLGRIPTTSRDSSRSTSAIIAEAVRNRTGMSAVRGSARSARRVAGPSMNGIITSRRMASGRSRAALATPSAPEAAVIVSIRARARLIWTSSRVSASSSMMRTFMSSSARGRPCKIRPHPVSR